MRASPAEPAAVRIGRLHAARIASTLRSARTASAPSASARFASSGPATATISEIPSPSEMAWLRRLGPVTRSQHYRSWLRSSGAHAPGDRPAPRGAAGSRFRRCAPDDLRDCPCGLPRGPGRFRPDRRPCRRRPDLGRVRRRRRPDLLRPGARHRRRRRARPCRGRLRGREQAHPPRPADERRQPARVAGRAGLPHGRRHDGRALPERPQSHGRRREHRLRDVTGRRPDLARGHPAGADRDLGPARALHAGQRSGPRLRRLARRLAGEHARHRSGRDATHHPPLPRRRCLDRADRCGTRAGGGHRLRQELADVRQRRGQPFPRSLLPRVHAGRRAGGRRRRGGTALGRRRRDLVRGGDGSRPGDRRDPGRPAERDR